MFFRLYDRRPSGGELWFNALEYIPDHDTLFPLHDSCIAIAEAVITQHRTKQPDFLGLSNLAILNQLLQSRYRKSWSAAEDFPQRCTNNDLFDLCSNSETYGPRSVVALTLLEWWHGDFEVSSLRLFSYLSIDRCGQGDKSTVSSNLLLPSVTNYILEILYGPPPYTKPHAFCGRNAPELSPQNNPLHT
jgi:hypothetical protein